MCELEELPADKVEVSPVSPNNGQNSIPAKPDPITLLLRAFGKVDGDCVVFFPLPPETTSPAARKIRPTGTRFRIEQKFTGRLNLDDKEDTEFADKGFLAQADSLCHNAREQKIKRERDKADRDAFAKKLQEEAEQERLRRQSGKK